MPYFPHSQKGCTDVVIKSCTSSPEAVLSILLISIGLHLPLEEVSDILYSHDAVA